MLAEKKGLPLSRPIPNHVALEAPQRIAAEHNDKRTHAEEIRICSELFQWSDFLRLTSNIKTF